MERARQIGVEAYSGEQREKIEILHYLLANFNDGRRKNFFCVAVNLLELSELREAIEQIRANDELPSLSLKAQALYAAEVLQKIAGRRNINLKLTRKK